MAVLRYIKSNIYNILIRVVFHFMQFTVYRKKRIQVQSTIIPLTELTWQRLDYTRYSKLKYRHIGVPPY
jgi:hypothetical protein